MSAIQGKSKQFLWDKQKEGMKKERKKGRK
jgi:hypothetical protein